MSKEIDCKYTREITCPYCGYVYSNSWECRDYDENEECGMCGEIFTYERIVTVQYSTYKNEE